MIGFVSSLTFLPYYCCLLNQSVPVLVALLGVFGDKYGCWAQSLTLLCIDSCLTLLCTSSCLSVCHTENIISLHASIESAVAWNGTSKFLSLIGCALNTVEHTESVLVSLLLLGSLSLSVSEIHSLGLWGLMRGAFIFVDAVEFVDGRGRNWLWPLILIKGRLPSYRCPPRDERPQFGLWSQTSCHCAWQIRRWRTTCTWCWLAGQCHAQLPALLIGNWSYHKSNHKRFHSSLRQGNLRSL